MSVQRQPSTIVPDPLASQFQNLDINTDIALHMTGSNVVPTDRVVENTSRSNSNRSISDAGLHNVPFIQPIPTIRAQTAPARSDNFYGFNYPFAFYQYEASVNNNNIIPHQVTLDSNYRPFLPISVPNVGSSFHPNLPFSENSNCITTTTPPVVSESFSSQVPNNDFGRHVMNVTTQGPTTPYPGGLLQLPHVPYMFMPPGTPPLQNSGTTTPRTISPNTHQALLAAVSESPEKNNMPCNLPAGSGNSNPTYDSQLRVNVESNDNSAHSWHPLPSGASGLNYPYLPHQVFHLSPGTESQTNFSMSPKTSKQCVPTTLQYSPMYWNHGPVSFQPFPYPATGYFPMSAVDMSNTHQVHINKQKQMLNSLHYGCVKTKLEIATCKEEIKELELQLKDQGSKIQTLPRQEQLEEEICKLRTECLCLSNEVDLYSEEKAPLGEISDDFYSCINTGQQGLLFPDAKQASKKPPPRPPRPSKNKLKQISKEEEKEEEENSESSKWLCTECTFRNHPLISEYCEMCNQPRNSTGRDT